MTKAFLAVNGGQGAASARVREQVTDLTDAVVAALDQAQARRRRDPHRGNPGPGRAGADARRRARSRARLRAVSREALAGARRARAARRASRAEHVINVIENGIKQAARHRAPHRRSSRRRAKAWPTSSPTASSRRRSRTCTTACAMDEVRKGVVLSARTLIEKDPAYSLRHRAPAARRAALRGARRRSHAGGDGDQVRRVLPALHQARHQDRPAQRGAAAVRHERSSARRSSRERDLQVRLPRPADAVRPLLPVDQYAVRRPAAASSCRSASSCAWRWAWR